MRICYFGIYNPDFGRNKIYIQALKSAGHQIIECRDDSPGLIKYWRLWRKHRLVKNDYDVLVVGYPGHLVVPLATLLTKRRVVADLLGSLYDAEVNSHYPSFFRKIKSRLADWLAVRFAHKILLESEAQKKYFEAKFGRSDKYEVVYTGAADKFAGENIKKMPLGNGEFLIVFRGKLTPECGISYVLEALKLLKIKTHIKLKVIGSGYLLEEVGEFIVGQQLNNVEVISRFLSDEELVSAVSGADLMLGQFEDNPRLNRTIPHKAFEALALGVAYLTGDAPAAKEVVSEGVTGFLVPLANAVALGEKIDWLSRQPELLARVSKQGQQLFGEKFSGEKLAEKIVKLML